MINIKSDFERNSNFLAFFFAFIRGGCLYEARRLLEEIIRGNTVTEFMGIASNNQIS